MFNTIQMTPGQVLTFKEPYDFVRVMEAGSTLTLEFYRAGREVEEALTVGVGYSESFGQPCDELRITNGAQAQTIKVATRLGSKVSYDKPPSGDVNNAPASGVFQSEATVTSAATNIIGTNSARRALFIQNKSTTGAVWLNFSGNAATQLNGIKLEPGESWSQDTRCPVGAVSAIGDIASNTDVVLMELS